MTKVFVTLLVTAMLSPLATPALASNAIAEKCGPDGPEVYKRPGGYCEQVKVTRSMGSEITK
jgi:hypothetical protein